MSAQIIPRTNNGLEGWHNAFHVRIYTQISLNLTIGKFFQNIVGDHPSFFEFLKDIIREEKNTIVVTTQMLVGTTIQSKRKKYEKIDSRIKDMVKKYDQVSLDDYLKIARSVFKF